MIIRRRNLSFSKFLNCLFPSSEFEVIDAEKCVECGAKALASSAFDKFYGAEKAFDGKDDTYWCSKAKNEHDSYLQFSFAKPTPVSKVTITYTRRLSLTQS